MLTYATHRALDLTLYEVDQWDWPTHQHQFLELVYVLDGHGTHTINELRYAYAPGSLFLLTPADAHAFAVVAPSRFAILVVTELYAHTVAPGPDAGIYQQLEYIFLNHRLHNGEPVRHFMGTSTFAEATVMPEIALAKIDPEAPLDRACLFACGLSTGLGAAMNTAKVEEGSFVVVFGAGMVGLGAVAGARLMGAERIVCVDLSEDRLALATGQGATDTFVGGPDAVERVLELTDGFGADYTFEATGNVKVMAQAVEAARMGWGLCTVTGVAGKGETLDVIPRWLITGRRIAGSSFGGVKGRDQVPQFVQRYMDGDIDVDAFLSHRISLDEVNKGFELMHDQDGIRSVIELS